MPPTRANVQTARYNFFTDPKTFLEGNLIRIFGAGVNQGSGVAFFTFFPNGTATNASGQVVPQWAVRYTAPAATPGDPVPPGGDVQNNNGEQVPYEMIKAHYVAMKKLADVVAGTTVTHYMLPHTGLDFMLTSQLSACTFGIGNQPQGGGVICSHIEGDPSTKAQRENLRDVTNQFMPSGSRSYQKNSGTFENKHRYKGKAMVVGKRNDHGRWKFYSQRHDGGMGVYILSKVHQI